MQSKIVKLAYVGGLAFLLTGCGASQAKTTTKQTTAQSTSVQRESHHQDLIVGSFVDNDDGAAIQLKSDGTGQYVYADSGEPDTNDQLTWKKDGDHYIVTLQDSDVSSPLTATFAKGELTLSGDSNWNTEHFKKSSKKVNLDQFLADQHKSQGTSATTSGENGASAEAEGGSKAGQTKDYTSSNGASHHVVMSGNDDGDGRQMGVDYETDPDGSHHVFQYVEGMNNDN